MNKRKKMLSVTSLLLLSIFIFVGSAYAATYNVSATWSLYVVNGWNNGKTYSLSSGNAELESVGKITKNETGIEKETYYAELLKHNDWLPDSSLGTKTQYATDDGFNNTATWSVSSAGTYYFIFSKAEKLNTLTVNGTLTNP